MSFLTTHIHRKLRNSKMPSKTTPRTLTVMRNNVFLTLKKAFKIINFISIRFTKPKKCNKKYNRAWNFWSISRHLLSTECKMNSTFLRSLKKMLLANLKISSICFNKIWTIWNNLMKSSKFKRSSMTPLQIFQTFKIGTTAYKRVVCILYSELF